MQLFDASPKLYFGCDALDYLLSLPRKKAFVVTDPYMVSSGMVKVVTGRLERRGIPYTVFSQVEPDPSIETIAVGLRQIFHEKPETVIALGGGSAIDATKGMLYFCLKLKGALMGERYVHHPAFIAIPTTSGTGSEVTSYAVISDRQRGVKIPLSDRSMIPDAAILDPEFTKTLPKDMIAFTGMDVLTHAVEAYVSSLGNDFTDMCALDAARKVLRHLPRMHADPAELLHREKMHIASTLAGLAFTNSGLGIGHGIAHTMGAEFHLPHGKANSIVLPYIIAFNAGLSKYPGHGILDRYARLARGMGIGSGDDHECARRLVATVQVLCEQFGVPPSLREAGVPEQPFMESIPACVEKILADITTQANPVRVTGEDVRGLLLDIYRGELVI